MTKTFHKWHHHNYHMTWVQFTDQIQNEDQIWYLRFSKHYCLQILPDMLGRQKNLINDISMTFTLSGYNLPTRYEMRTRFGISSSTCTIAFKLFQICWGKKGFHQWRHRICLVTLVQFADQVKNEDQSWYLRFHIHHCLQTVSYMLDWQ